MLFKHHNICVRVLIHLPTPSMFFVPLLAAPCNQPTHPTPSASCHFTSRHPARCCAVPLCNTRADNHSQKNATDTLELNHVLLRALDAY